MIKFYVPSLCLILLSCGGASDAGNTDITPSDSLVEIDVNEDRVTAVEFNNDLSYMQQDMLNGMDELFGSDSSGAASAHNAVLFEAEMNLADLNEIEFDGSETAFVEAMKSLMNWYIEELNGPFMPILTILEKGEWSEDDKKVLNQYDVEYAEREKEAYDPVFKAQEEFAKMNNIRLEDQ